MFVTLLSGITGLSLWGIKVKLKKSLKLSLLLSFH